MSRNGIFVFFFCLMMIVVPGRVFASGHDPPLVIVPIAVFIDEAIYTFDSEAAITKEVEEIIDFVNKVFEHLFRIRFSIVQVSVWRFSPGISEISIEDAMDNIETLENSPKYDLILVFPARKLFLCIPKPIAANTEDWNEFINVCPYGEGKEYKSGSALQLGERAIVELSDERKYVALHEIGHMFGAIHTHEYSVMHSFLVVPTEFFDEKNKERIMANRYRFVKDDY